MNNVGGIIKKALGATAQHVVNTVKAQSGVSIVNGMKAFQKVDQLPGLFLLVDAISPEDEKEIIKDLKEKTKLFPANWEESLSPRRRQAMFGWPLKLRAKLTDYAPVPTWASNVWDTLLNTTNLSSIVDLHKEPVDSFVVIKYENGMGIHDHTDEEDYYGSYVIGLCLALDAEMVYVPSSDPYQVSPYTIELPARSVYLLTGHARYEYLHGIRNRTLPGGLRVSVTMRNHKEKFLTNEIRKEKPILPCVPHESNLPEPV